MARGFFWLRALFARLDTTPGQEKAIRAAFDELRAKSRAVKDDAKGMRGDLASALRGDSLDAETLGTVALARTGAVDALRDAGIGAVLKVHEVLDPRQRAILADLLESGPRFGGSWGRRGRDRDWRGRGGPYRGAARAYQAMRRRLLIVVLSLGALGGYAVWDSPGFTPPSRLRRNVRHIIGASSAGPRAVRSRSVATERVHKW